MDTSKLQSMEHVSEGRVEDVQNVRKLNKVKYVRMNQGFNFFFRKSLLCFGNRKFKLYRLFYGKSVETQKINCSNYFGSIDASGKVVGFKSVRNRSLGFRNS